MLVFHPKAHCISSNTHTELFHYFSHQWVENYEQMTTIHHHPFRFCSYNRKYTLLQTGVPDTNDKDYESIFT